MILDSSAVIAILLREPEYESLLPKLATVSAVGIGVPTLTEATIVMSARIQGDARGWLARFLSEASVVTVPFGDVHWGAAVDAWLRYGKGRHPANLNFGDCMAYATAKVSGEPLLFVREDFARTDIEIA
jgi:ribonuclease VapC